MKVWYSLSVIHLNIGNLTHLWYIENLVVKYFLKVIMSYFSSKLQCSTLLCLVSVVLLLRRSSHMQSV